jgi:hypothetical protein
MPRGRKDVLGRELAERLSAHTGDDAREQVIAAVVGAELGRRREIDASLPGERPQNMLVDLDVRRWWRREFDQEERIAQSGGVREEMPNGNAILSVHPFGHVLPDLVVQRQFPLFDEEHDTERRHWLRDRRRIEDGRPVDAIAARAYR